MKSYMLHLQQFTKKIKIPTLQAYFSLKFIKIEADETKKRLIFTF